MTPFQHGLTCRLFRNEPTSSPPPAALLSPSFPAVFIISVNIDSMFLPRLSPLPLCLLCAQDKGTDLSLTCLLVL